MAYRDEHEVRVVFSFSSRYFRCVYNHNHWTHETVACRCGTLFNMRTQECVSPRNWTPYCVELVTPILLRSCGEWLKTLQLFSIKNIPSRDWHENPDGRQ
jgi:hypothetical protein